MICCLFKGTLNTHSVKVLSVQIFVHCIMTGEVTDSEASESYSSALSQEEFNDGYDENLMGDEEDQARLAQMTEKEREQEIFKRIEQREVMKTRYGLKFLCWNEVQSYSSPANTARQCKSCKF